jgi:peptide/nickel transport system substrate-binding protein
MTEARTMDPARNADYMPPLVIGNVYETLVTMEPGQYDTLVPGLAVSWEKKETFYRFHLRRNVVFANGQAMTSADVKYSFDRLIETKDQPAEYASNIAGVRIVDDFTVDLLLKNPSEPILVKLVAPAFSVYSRAVASKQDVTRELNNTSYGSSAYKLVRWEPNNIAVLERHDAWWGGKAPFRRVIVRHIPDAGAQFLALRRGDIDIAMNLTADHLAQLSGNTTVAEANGIDFIYMTLNSNPQLNVQLANKDVRQAIAAAIDYDGMIRGLVAGHAIRPPSFIPVGIQGVTENDVRTIGYNQNLERARQLLAGRSITFDLAYTPTNIGPTNYELIAQKIRSDLARVGIRVNLVPMEAAALRTALRAGQLQSVITFWDPDGPEADLLASAVVGRVAGRIGWDSTPLRDLVRRAAAEEDTNKRKALYREFQVALVDQANLVVLMQPRYRLGVSNNITNVQLNAAGWRVELERVQVR